MQNDVGRFEGAEGIIKFWSALDVSGSTLVHPLDQRWMLDPRQVGQITSIAPTTANEWVIEARTSRVQLGLLPVPYLGDLHNADIIICLLNPGLAPGDFYAELRVPDFRETIARSLRQEFQADERYPFFFLDPQWCWTGGYQWWMKKLNGIVSKISDHHGCSFVDAASQLARRIAAVELFPYHSTVFAMHRGLTQLPSCATARTFIQGCADDPSKLVIITRQVKEWQISNNVRPGVVLYSDGQERGAHISPTSTGGRAILNKFGVE